MTIWIILIIVAIIAIGGLMWHLEKKRIEALRAQARALGLSFSSERDRGMANRLERFNNLRNGRNHYVKNALKGTYREAQIVLCEHHYETKSTNNKGETSTKHHWHAVTTVRLPRHFPELTVAREGLLSKVAQFVGYEDIDFESHEFSRRFVVRSKNRRFAYDFLHPRALELFLTRQSLFGNLEVDGNLVALMRPGRINPQTFQADLDFLCDLVELIPNHLDTTHA